MLKLYSSVKKIFLRGFCGKAKIFIATSTGRYIEPKIKKKN